MKAVVLAVLLAVLPMLAQAVEPDEILADPALEARARVISKQLRCVVCQNQDIDSSNAGVARDLRLLVRERLTAGDSNAEVVDYIHARYGDFVLLKPPFTRRTVVLWLAPLVLIFAAVLAGGLSLSPARRRRTDAALDPEDEARIAAAMDRYKQGGSE
jgi:cytochrome c-type biogenesis protein CcmH